MPVAIKKPLSQKGFTLIELAIVLVVLGILIALGTGLVGILTKQAKLRETREIVKQAREAVIGFAVKNGYLPLTLEDAGARKLDAWGNELVYYPTPEFDSNTENACGVNSTAMQVYECQNSGCSTYLTKYNIAFVVYSKGFDGNGDGTGTTSPFRVRLQDDPYTSGGNTYYYDDIVQYASLDEIRSLRGCPQPLQIISPATLPQGEEDSFYSYSMEAIGGKPPYTWTGSAGSGLSLSSSGLISGTINVYTSTNTGELTACSASISVNATVTDSAGSPSQSYIGTIPVRPKPLKIITETLPSAYEGSPYSATISASGGRIPYTWSMSVSPACPAGLTCSGNTITGTPNTGTAGTYTVSSTVNDTCTTNTKNFVLTINPSGGGGSCPALSLTPPSGTSWSATVGTPFSQSITVSGGQTPYTNTGCTPSSCNGLSLTCTNTGATISGTPTTSGTCTFNVSWQDSCPTPQTISGTYTVDISLPACAPFTGWSDILPPAYNCQSYSGSITVLGGVSPYSWTYTGTLPTGINFCTGNTTNTCNLTGSQVLSAPGTNGFTVTVTDSCTNPGPQSTSNSYSITVNDACYTTGITLRNSSGANRWYKKNGGTCTQWNRNANITVLPSDTYNIYSDNTCTTLYCTAPVTYCQQKGYDTDGDCQTQMNDPCTFADR